jgi:uncharacterized SAM-binding protein YcdF (DUF218 family)
MLLSKIDETKLTDKDINKILFDIPKDDGLNGDCIWVFGSINDLDERLNLAIELFKKGRAPYLLFSGGKGKTGVVLEAQLMKEKAIKLDIPEDVILTEEESFNTTENILCSMLVLERKFLLQNINRLIIVTSPFHVQRLSLTLERYMPEWIKYSYCYDENSPVSKNNWTNNEESRNRVEYEAQGIVFYAKNKYINDKDIKLD